MESLRASLQVKLDERDSELKTTQLSVREMEREKLEALTASEELKAEYE